MRVCIVSLNIVPFYRKDSRGAGFGGAEVQAAFLADALAKAGQDVTLVVSDLPPGESVRHPAESAFASDAGVRGFRFFHPRASGIVRALARADADVYYQRNAGMITGLTAAFCRARGRVFVYGAGSNTDFSMRDVRIDGLRDRALYYMGLRIAHGIVVQNNEQRRELLEKFDKPVAVIPNGVNAVRDHDATRQLVLWVGALRRVKRPELFVDLARGLPDHRFVMVGGHVESERSYADDIRRLAAPLQNLELTGRVSPERVGELLGRSRVLVNTSRVEGFPNAYLEAWTQGVPVVSFNDVDDLIRSQRLGRVCESIDDMRNVLAEILGDEDGVRAMGERARTLVERRFSPGALVPRYTQFFEQLMQAR